MKTAMILKPRHLLTVFLFLAAALFPVLLSAGPTGAPLLTFPLHPCRVLDTRVSLGPLQGGWAMDVHVRGDQLLASEGAQQADCGVPPEAEAVMVNIAVLAPLSGGYLKVNGTGRVGDPNYSRLNYRAGENDSNEMLVNLCNVYLYPNPHEACGFDGARYLDFQILNMAPSASSTHIVADVVGYFARE